MKPTIPRVAFLNHRTSVGVVLKKPLQVTVDRFQDAAIGALPLVLATTVVLNDHTQAAQGVQIISKVSIKP